MTAHEKTSIAYRPTRDESEEIIRMLCEHYPKCFFEEPRRRLPLKKNITTDIIKDGDFDVSPEMIGAAMEWYSDLVADGSHDARRFSRFEDDHDCVGLGPFEVVTTALRCFDNRDVALFGPLRHPALKLVGDVAQGVPRHRV
jgi:ProQ/FINO family